MTVRTVIIDKKFLVESVGRNNILVSGFKLNCKTLHINLGIVDRVEIAINKGDFHRLKKIHIVSDQWDSSLTNVKFTGDMCYKCIKIEGTTVVNTDLTETTFTRLKELSLDNVSIEGKPLVLSNSFFNRVNLNSLSIKGDCDNFEVTADIKQIVENVQEGLVLTELTLMGDSNLSHISKWPSHVALGNIEEVHGVITSGTNLRHLAVYSCPGFRGTSVDSKIDLDELTVLDCPLATSSVLRYIKMAHYSKNKYRHLKITTDVADIPEEQVRVLQDILTVNGRK